MRNIGATILAVLTAASAFAAAPSVTATVAPAEAPFHNAFIVTLIVEGDATLQVEFPDMPFDSEKLETHRLDGERVAEDKNRVRATQRYLLDPIFPGHYRVPSLSLSYSDVENAGGTVETPPLAFHARPLTEAEEEAIAKFSGIAAPETVLPPRRVSRGTLVALALALLAVAGAVGLFLYKKRTPEQPVVVLEPWEVALNRLRELQRRDLPGSGNVDAYYVDLSSILRYYIEDRFRVRAPEQTTPEFLESAARTGAFTTEQQDFLAAFLRQCDRVKFARLQPGMEDMTDHFKQVRHFVKDTTPKQAEGDALEDAA